METMALAYNTCIDELDATSPRAANPVDANIQLKQHQLAILHRCIQFENERIPLSSFASLRQHDVESSSNAGDYMRTHIGILGDKVGSGKSYILLALVLANQNTRQEPTVRTYGCNKVVIWEHDQSRTTPVNLLVIPHNLSNQWEQYIKSFSNKIKYLMVCKNRVIEQLYDANPPVDLVQYDLIVVTSTFYNRLAHLLNSKSLKLFRAIFDEVDSMNIPGCVQVESEFYWFVTASYGNLLYPRGYSRYDPVLRRHIQNATGLRNAGFVKNLFLGLFSSVSSDYTRILVVKNQDAFVQASIELPILNNHFIECRTPAAINILNGLVDKNIIDCLNAGDVTSAIQLVNPQNRRTEDNIVALLIERYTKQVKNIQVRIEYTQHYEFDNEAQKQAELDQLTKKSIEMDQKIQSIKERVRDSNVCCICYDQIENKTVVPCCSNSYCFKCISMWLCRVPSCPICKASMGMSNLLVVQHMASASTTSLTTSSNADHSHELHRTNDKIKNLENILRRLPENAKLLIFSSYENSFTNVLVVLQQLNMPYAYLKGNGSQIKSTIDQYKNGNLNVLLINSRNYGSGLNLENTSDIILFHKFDSEIEKQVIGRAHRYGRSHPLNVWYLLYENEITNNTATMTL